MKHALEELAAALFDNCAIDVTVETNDSVHSCRAVPARTKQEVRSEYDGVLEIEAQTLDFLFYPSDYDCDPQIGDVVNVVGTGERYAVTGQYENRTLGSTTWRWSDSYHILKRVHTKRIESNE